MNVGALVRVGADHGDGEDRLRLRQRLGRRELLPVHPHRLHRAIGVDMPREGEADANCGGDLRAVVARTEQPDRRQRDIDRHGPHRPEGVIRRELVGGEGEQFPQLGGEVVRRQRLARAAEGEGGQLIRAGGAANAEVDPPRIERFQDAEGLDDFERRVIRQHDAAGADAEMRRLAGDRPDDDLRRGTGDTGHVVVLSEPVARESEPVGQPRQIDRVPQRLTSGRAGANRGKVED